MQQLKEFYLDDYLSEYKNKVGKDISSGSDVHTRFLILCDRIKKYFDEEWENEHSKDRDSGYTLSKRIKDAILGYTSEVNYFKDKIREFLKNNNLMGEKYPSYYKNLVDGIFHENWGLAGIAPWLDIEDSSSAKIIGNKIFYLIDGKMRLMEQRISQQRLEQLRDALLLGEPNKSKDNDYLELFLLTGERVAIYTGDMVIKNQPSMVFRKYIIEALTFVEQARRGTIPYEAIPLFISMAQMGVNVVFTGPVRSGKSTMLLTYQLCEDKELEGVFVQTDPEIKINDFMPTAPIIPILADGEELIKLAKQILRSDADYIVMAEARDGYAFYIMVEAANKGTNRMKATMHLSHQEDFAYDVANKIHSVIGGKLEYIIAKVAKSFNYIIEMTSLPENKAMKRLMSITEVRYDDNTHEISYHTICQYNKETDSWSFAYDIGPEIEKLGRFENPIALNVFKNTLRDLSEKYYMDPIIKKPIYSKLTPEEV